MLVAFRKICVAKVYAWTIERWKDGPAERCRDTEANIPATTG